jgi:predicted dehydrogenase
MIDALVIGGGSIGKRHLRNILATGRSAAVVETRGDRGEEIRAQHPGTRVFSELETALREGRYRTALICVPTAHHLAPALACAKAGINVFMEKPISHSLDGVDELVKTVAGSGLVGMMGFCMRFFLPLQRAREIVAHGTLGRIVAARSLTAVYLPDWHPWEDYRSFYMARKDQGGGVLLDECHAFDWMQWLCGPIEGVCAVVGTFSDLEVDTDDVCEVIVRFAGRAVGTIHLDMVDRSIRSEVEIIGTESTLIVDLEGHTVRLWDAKARRWDTERFEPAYDPMYVQELEHFFACVEGRQRPVVDLEAGHRIQRILDACARSSASGRWITVD